MVSGSGNNISCTNSSSKSNTCINQDDGSTKSEDGKKSSSRSRSRKNSRENNSASTSGHNNSSRSFLEAAAAVCRDSLPLPKADVQQVSKQQQHTQQQHTQQQQQIKEEQARQQHMQQQKQEHQQQKRQPQQYCKRQKQQFEKEGRILGDKTMSGPSLTAKCNRNSTGKRIVGVNSVKCTGREVAGGIDAPMMELTQTHGEEIYSIAAAEGSRHPTAETGCLASSELEKLFPGGERMMKEKAATTLSGAVPLDGAGKKDNIPAALHMPQEGLVKGIMGAGTESVTPASCPAVAAVQIVPTQTADTRVGAVAAKLPEALVEPPSSRGTAGTAGGAKQAGAGGLVRAEVAGGAVNQEEEGGGRAMEETPAIEVGAAGDAKSQCTTGVVQPKTSETGMSPLGGHVPSSSAEQQPLTAATTIALSGESNTAGKVGVYVLSSAPVDTKRGKPPRRAPWCKCVLTAKKTPQNDGVRCERQQQQQQHEMLMGEQQQQQHQNAGRHLQGSQKAQYKQQEVLLGEQQQQQGKEVQEQQKGEQQQHGAEPQQLQQQQVDKQLRDQQNEEHPQQAGEQQQQQPQQQQHVDKPLHEQEEEEHQQEVGEQEQQQQPDDKPLQEKHKAKHQQHVCGHQQQQQGAITPLQEQQKERAHIKTAAQNICMDGDLLIQKEACATGKIAAIKTTADNASDITSAPRRGIQASTTTTAAVSQPADATITQTAASLLGVAERPQDILKMQSVGGKQQQQFPSCECVREAASMGVANREEESTLLSGRNPTENIKQQDMNRSKENSAQRVQQHDVLDRCNRREQQPITAMTHQSEALTRERLALPVLSKGDIAEGEGKCKTRITSTSNLLHSSSPTVAASGKSASEAVVETVVEVQQKEGEQQRPTVPAVAYTAAVSPAMIAAADCAEKSLKTKAGGTVLETAAGAAVACPPPPRVAGSSLPNATSIGSAAAPSSLRSADGAAASAAAGGAPTMILPHVHEGSAAVTAGTTSLPVSAAASLTTPATTPYTPVRAAACGRRTFAAAAAAALGGGNLVKNQKTSSGISSRQEMTIQQQQQQQTRQQQQRQRHQLRQHQQHLERVGQWRATTTNTITTTNNHTNPGVVTLRNAVPEEEKKSESSHASKAVTSTEERSNSNTASLLVDQSAAASLTLPVGTHSSATNHQERQQQQQLLTSIPPLSSWGKKEAQHPQLHLQDACEQQMQQQHRDQEEKKPNVAEKEQPPQQQLQQQLEQQPQRQPQQQREQQLEQQPVQQPELQLPQQQLVQQRLCPTLPSQIQQATHQQSQQSCIQTQEQKQETPQQSVCKREGRDEDIDEREGKEKEKELVEEEEEEKKKSERPKDQKCLVTSTREANGGGDEALSIPLTSTILADRRSVFYKTQLCPHAVRGRCRLDAQCNFAHSRRELRPPPRLDKTKICANIKAGVVCPNGQQCLFAHNREELRHSVAFYKTNMCHSWLSGACMHPHTCNHAHGRRELFFFRTLAAVAGCRDFCKEKHRVAAAVTDASTPGKAASVAAALDSLRRRLAASAASSAPAAVSPVPHALSTTVPSVARSSRVPAESRNAVVVAGEDAHIREREDEERGIEVATKPKKQEFLACGPCAAGRRPTSMIFAAGDADAAPLASAGDGYTDALWRKNEQHRCSHSSNASKKSCAQHIDSSSSSEATTTPNSSPSHGCSQDTLPSNSSNKSLSFSSSKNSNSSNRNSCSMYMNSISSSSSNSSSSSSSNSVTPSPGCTSTHNYSEPEQVLAPCIQRRHIISHQPLRARNNRETEQQRCYQGGGGGGGEEGGGKGRETSTSHPMQQQQREHEQQRENEQQRGNEQQRENEQQRRTLQEGSKVLMQQTRARYMQQQQQLRGKGKCVEGTSNDDLVALIPLLPDKEREFAEHLLAFIEASATDKEDTASFVLSLPPELAIEAAGSRTGKSTATSLAPAECANQAGDLPVTKSNHRGRAAVTATRMNSPSATTIPAGLGGVGRTATAAAKQTPQSINKGYEGGIGSYCRQGVARSQTTCRLEADTFTSTPRCSDATITADKFDWKEGGRAVTTTEIRKSGLFTSSSGQYYYQAGGRGGTTTTRRGNKTITVGHPPHEREFSHFNHSTAARKSQHQLQQQKQMKMLPGSSGAARAAAELDGVAATTRHPISVGCVEQARHPSEQQQEPQQQQQNQVITANRRPGGASETSINGRQIREKCARTNTDNVEIPVNTFMRGDRKMELLHPELRMTVQQQGPPSTQHMLPDGVKQLGSIQKLENIFTNATTYCQGSFTAAPVTELTQQFQMQKEMHYAPRQEQKQLFLPYENSAIMCRSIHQTRTGAAGETGGYPVPERRACSQSLTVVERATAFSPVDEGLNEATRLIAHVNNTLSSCESAHRHVYTGMYDDGQQQPHLLVHQQQVLQYQPCNTEEQQQQQQQQKNGDVTDAEHTPYNTGRSPMRQRRNTAAAAAVSGKRIMEQEEKSSWSPIACEPRSLPYLEPGVTKALDEKGSSREICENSFPASLSDCSSILPLSGQERAVQQTQQEQQLRQYDWQQQQQRQMQQGGLNAVLSSPPPQNAAVASPLDTSSGRAAAPGCTGFQSRQLEYQEQQRAPPGQQWGHIQDQCEAIQSLQEEEPLGRPAAGTHSTHSTLQGASFLCRAKQQEQLQQGHGHGSSCYAFPEEKTKREKMEEAESPHLLNPSHVIALSDWGQQKKRSPVHTSAHIEIDPRWQQQEQQQQQEGMMRVPWQAQQDQWLSSVDKEKRLEQQQQEVLGGCMELQEQHCKTHDHPFNIARTYPLLWHLRSEERRGEILPAADLQKQQQARELPAAVKACWDSDEAQTDGALPYTSSSSSSLLVPPAMTAHSSSALVPSALSSSGPATTASRHFPSIETAAVHISCFPPSWPPTSAASRFPSCCKFPTEGGAAATATSEEPTTRVRVDALAAVRGAPAVLTAATTKTVGASTPAAALPPALEDQLEPAAALSGGGIADSPLKVAAQQGSHSTEESTNSSGEASQGSLLQQLLPINTGGTGTEQADTTIVAASTSSMPFTMQQNDTRRIKVAQTAPQEKVLLEGSQKQEQEEHRDEQQKEDKKPVQEGVKGTAVSHLQSGEYTNLDKNASDTISASGACGGSFEEGVNNSKEGSATHLQPLLQHHDVVKSSISIQPITNSHNFILSGSGAFPPVTGDLCATKAVSNVEAAISLSAAGGLRLEGVKTENVGQMCVGDTNEQAVSPQQQQLHFTREEGNNENTNDEAACIENRTSRGDNEVAVAGRTNPGTGEGVGKRDGGNTGEATRRQGPATERSVLNEPPNEPTAKPTGDQTTAIGKAPGAQPCIQPSTVWRPSTREVTPPNLLSVIPPGREEDAAVALKKQCTETKADIRGLEAATISRSTEHTSIGNGATPETAVKDSRNRSPCVRVASAVAARVPGGGSKEGTVILAPGRAGIESCGGVPEQKQDSLQGEIILPITQTDNNTCAAGERVGSIMDVPKIPSLCPFSSITCVSPSSFSPPAGGLCIKGDAGPQRTSLVVSGEEEELVQTSGGAAAVTEASPAWSYSASTAAASDDYADCRFMLLPHNCTPLDRLSTEERKRGGTGCRTKEGQQERQEKRQISGVGREGHVQGKAVLPVSQEGHDRCKGQEGQVHQQEQLAQSQPHPLQQHHASRYLFNNLLSTKPSAAGSGARTSSASLTEEMLRARGKSSMLQHRQQHAESTASLIPLDTHHDLHSHNSKANSSSCLNDGHSSEELTSTYITPRSRGSSGTATGKEDSVQHLQQEREYADSTFPSSNDNSEGASNMVSNSSRYPGRSMRVSISKSGSVNVSNVKKCDSTSNSHRGPDTAVLGFLRPAEMHHAADADGISVCDVNNGGLKKLLNTGLLSEQQEDAVDIAHERTTPNTYPLMDMNLRFPAFQTTLPALFDTQQIPQICWEQQRETGGTYNQEETRHRHETQLAVRSVEEQHHQEIKLALQQPLAALAADCFPVQHQQAGEARGEKERWFHVDANVAVESSLTSTKARFDAQFQRKEEENTHPFSLSQPEQACGDGKMSLPFIRIPNLQHCHPLGSQTLCEEEHFQERSDLRDTIASAELPVTVSEYEDTSNHNTSNSTTGQSSLAMTNAVVLIERMIHALDLEG